MRLQAPRFSFWPSLIVQNENKLFSKWYCSFISIKRFRKKSFCPLYIIALTATTSKPKSEIGIFGNYSTGSECIVNIRQNSDLHKRSGPAWSENTNTDSRSICCERINLSVLGLRSRPPLEKKFASALFQPTSRSCWKSSFSAYYQIHPAVMSNM